MIKPCSLVMFVRYKDVQQLRNAKFGRLQVHSRPLTENAKTSSSRTRICELANELHVVMVVSGRTSKVRGVAEADLVPSLTRQCAFGLRNQSSLKLLDGSDHVLSSYLFFDGVRERPRLRQLL